MKPVSFLAIAALLCPCLAPAAEPAPDAATPAPRTAEPNVQRSVIEDDANRVEELKVRGQTRSIVVTTKGPIPGSYEIFIGDPSRDLSDAAGSRRGATGQRMWRVLTF
jgi:hypothetical protein